MALLTRWSARKDGRVLGPEAEGVGGVHHLGDERVLVGLARLGDDRLDDALGVVDDPLLRAAQDPAAALEAERLPCRLRGARGAGELGHLLGGRVGHVGDDLAGGGVLDRDVACRGGGAVGRRVLLDGGHCFAPASFDGVSNTTVGSDVARRPRPRRAGRGLPRLAHRRRAPALALHPVPLGGRGHARRVLPGQPRAALRARLARRAARPAAPRLPVRDLRLPPPRRADLLRRVRVGRGHRLGVGADRGPPRRAARRARARVRAGAPPRRGGDRRRPRRRPRRARRARRPRPGATERRCRPRSCPSRRSSRSRCRSARPGGRGRRSASSRCARPRPGRR